MQLACLMAVMYCPFGDGDSAAPLRAAICVSVLVTAKHSRLFDGENMCPFGDSKA